MRCSNCESSNIVSKNIKGRRFVYKNQGSVAITVDLDMPVCGDCEELQLQTGIDHQKLQDTLAETVKLKDDAASKIRCGSCGGKNIKRENRKGQFFPYMNEDKLQLKLDLFLPVCQDCRNQLLLSGDGDDLTYALDQSIFSADIIGTMCAYCDSETQLMKYDYESSRVDCHTGEKIIVCDASYHECLNADCKHSWMDQAQANFLEDEVQRRSRHSLSSDQIQSLVDKIGYKTRGTLSQKLGINSELLVNSLHGKSSLPFTYDLLLMLLAHDPKNVEFVNKLSENAFKYDASDYNKKEE